jgi:hypothetical protein
VVVTNSSEELTASIFRVETSLSFTLKMETVGSSELLVITTLHGVTSEKMGIFIVTTMRA